MGEWTEYKISDIATLVKNSWKVGDEKLSYLGLEHIEEAKLRLNGIGSSDDVASNKYRFSSNDVLFGKLRPYFRKVVKPNFDGICSTDMWVLNATEKSDIDFIFYFFANQELIDLSYSSSSGTRMPRADWKFLSQTLWDIPPLEEQKAIAEVLSSLDDKIDLLHRQNKTLEELAQTLFRQWFIEEADEGWEVGVLDDILTVKGGTTPSTKNNEFWDGNICWSTPKDLSTNSDMYLFDTARKITESGLSKISSGLLPIGTVLLSSRAPVGYLAIAEVPLAINQGYIAILDDKGFSKYFIYLWLKSNMEYVISNANGSTFLEISKTVFKSLEIIKPPKYLRDRFDEIVLDNFEKIKSNTKQIKSLENMRDTLLPKLMSGEVRVKLNGVNYA